MEGGPGRFLGGREMAITARRLLLDCTAACDETGSRQCIQDSEMVRAVILGSPYVGERCVVLARVRRREAAGRKRRER